MQKRLIACLLLFALIGSSFSRILVYAGFEVNQDYIAKTLCVNKDRPWMNCNGKCYLMKKVQQAEENEKKEATKDLLSNLSISFFERTDAFNFQSPVTATLFTTSYPEYTCHYSNCFLGSIFQPPKLAA
ncbi:hypothetical protein LPB86_18590 [Pedobacter sp. MC2016-14]|uniref:hypothetical protein n=1 Tax=Pedobacter sp. MC2016-14 TaxID=2897327 RepID=UPI001E518359|nr:hypothetical protein [Pedobacter sp. MC2016-14]MCD0490256.1 hypothetical protein [Pedobacter sp. MC2016-14]